MGERRLVDLDSTYELGCLRIASTVKDEIAALVVSIALRRDEKKEGNTEWSRQRHCRDVGWFEGFT